MQQVLLTILNICYLKVLRHLELLITQKKKYFLITHHMKEADFSEADSLEIDKMSVKDHALVRYLGRNLSDTVMFTLQEKCINFVGNELVDKRFEQLVRARAASFQAYFAENGTLDRLKILQSKNSIPYDGFSYFKLTYPGEIPNSLAKAYHKMNELNDEIPRKKYIEQRKKEAVSRGEASPQ